MCHMMGFVCGMLLLEQWGWTKNSFRKRYARYGCTASYAGPISSYVELLNALRNPDGWTTEIGDAVVAGFATYLRRAIVVFTMRDAIVVIPLDGVLDNRPPLNVAYVNRAHFMHVRPSNANLPALIAEPSPATNPEPMAVEEDAPPKKTSEQPPSTIPAMFQAVRPSEREGSQRRVKTWCLG